MISDDFSRKKIECTLVNVTCGSKLFELVRAILQTSMHFLYIDVTKYYTELEWVCHNIDSVDKQLNDVAK